MNLSLQDMLVMWASILGPIGTLIGFMWHHFNNLGNDLRRELNSLRGELNGVEKRLDEKIDKKIDILRGELNGVEKRLDEKISSVEKKLDEKISSVEKKLDEKISSVERGLGEKIDAARDRISRIEGQLVPTKIVAFEEVRPKEITEQKNAIRHS
jgi:hypothetical protein